jgi:ABC-type lipoprotein release transport system permease subunit/ABC-type Zn uptake system ZnuABC Zn-binding protein ZnuA
LNLPFYIARRYLFAKKSHNAINIISLVSMCGVVVATVAMICTLSVFNGFKELTTTLFSVFDPQLKITAVEGKVFDPAKAAFDAVRRLPEVSLCCGTLQENALAVYGNRQEISILKGVDSSFSALVQIDTVIIDGSFKLNEGDINYAVLGIGLASSLGINAAFAYPIDIYMPKRNEVINIANPSAAFQMECAFVGGVYHINQPVYDEGFMIVSINMLRQMLDYETEVSALELRLVEGADVTAVKKKIISILGDEFAVKDRYEQQEASFKMVQIEKWVSFLMLCFILVLALFNLLGSLAILMIEKEDDVSKLRSMGADNRMINRIFLFEGWMISLFGAMAGVVIGLALCFLQQRFGLISLGATAGTFVVDAYPCEVEWMDVIIVFITVVVIGFLAVFYPVHFLGRKWLNKGVAIGLSALLMASCGGGTKDASTSHEIAVTVEPLRYFAEKIAADDYEFFAVVPAGQSPETYDPSPRETARIGKGRAFLHFNSLPVEHSITASIEENNPNIMVADVSVGMNFHDVKEDEHHTDHAHHDPHIWTSFAGARVVASNICKTLLVMNPDEEDVYLSRCKRFMDELQTLENQLHQTLDTLSCSSFVVYHPALTYFADEFGLTQISIEADGKEPSPATMKRLIDKALADKVRVVFVQIEFDRKHAEQVAAAIGARIVVINTLDYQWDKQMIRIAKALAGNEELD